jgi:hypothetical protein
MIASAPERQEVNSDGSGKDANIPSLLFCIEHLTIAPPAFERSYTFISGCSGARVAKYIEVVNVT